MATTLQEVLGYTNLCGIISDPKGGVPADILPPQFLTINRRVKGHTCTYLKVDGTRQTARLAHYGSAPQRRQLKGVADKPIVLLHSVEEMHHDTTVLDQLRNYEDQNAQRLGEQEIARQTAHARDLQNNLRVSCVYSTLSLGAVYYDGNGNLLPSSSGAAITIDWGVPSGNKNQIGGIIATKWSDAAALIPNQITALRAYGRKLTGYPLRYAYYGSSVLGWILANTACTKLIQGNPAYANAFGNGEIPDGFCKMIWRPFNEAYFEDNDGTLQDWCAADKVVFTPDPSVDWWEGIEGTYPVPTELTISSDAEEAAGNFNDVSGLFSYATIDVKPPGITQVYGDTFIYALKVPGAIFIADVDF